MVLRPHLQANATPEATAEASPSAEAAPEVQAETAESPSLLPPRTNTGAKPAPVQSGDILSRVGSGDLDFYEQNHEAIKKAWRQQKRTRTY